MSATGMSLFSIEEALVELLSAREELLAEAHPAFPSADQAAIIEERQAELAQVEKTLAEYVEREVKKVDGIHAYLKYADLTAIAARQEAAEYAARAKRLEASAERLEQLCIDVMQRAGKKRLEGTIGRVLAIQGNGGLAPLVVDEAVLPSEYRIVTVRMPKKAWEDITHGDFEDTSQAEVVQDVPNQAAIRAVLQAGMPVPGARLDERGVHLRVK